MSETNEPELTAPAEMEAESFISTPVETSEAPSIADESPSFTEPLSLTPVNTSSVIVSEETSNSSAKNETKDIINDPECTKDNTNDSLKDTTFDSPKPSTTFQPPSVPCFEEDTRSSWTADAPKTTAASALKEIEDDSQSSSRGVKRKYEEIDKAEVITGENLFEYQWPQEKGEFYFLQEQISDYLGVKSFKRKYPELARRLVEPDEKDMLKEKSIVTETQCELGLTALRSEDIMDLMSKDYPERYNEYCRTFQEKEKQLIKDKHKEYTTPSIDKGKMGEYVKKAVFSAAEYNAHLNHERKEERRACFDLQTFTILYPSGKKKKVADRNKMGKFPVALLPGQYQDYYRDYSPQELKYLPINTVLYGPPQELGTILTQNDSDNHSDSDDSSASEGSGNSSQESDDSDSSSDSEVASRNGVSTASNGNLNMSKSSHDNYKPKHKPNALCKACNGASGRNKEGRFERLIHCTQCDASQHPSCINLTSEMAAVVVTYPWQCMNCKTCSHCQDPNEESKMMFCDHCDRGYHSFCLNLKNVPTGRWLCKMCAVCASCQARSPGPEGSKAEWQREKMAEGESDVKKNQILCVQCYFKHRRLNKGV